MKDLKRKLELALNDIEVARRHLNADDSRWHHGMARLGKSRNRLQKLVDAIENQNQSLGV